MLLVRFSKNGFYHPATGRLGTGDNAGRVYRLPEDFRLPGMLPKSAEILNEAPAEVLEDILDEVNQREAAKVSIDRDELQRAVDHAKGKSKEAASRPAGVKTVAELQAETADEPQPLEEPQAAPKPRRSRRGA
jgi:hypothetical protein